MAQRTISPGTGAPVVIPSRSLEEDVSVWKDRIRNGQRFQFKFAMSGDWERYKNYYRHTKFRTGTIPVNIMFSILRSMVPQVYFRAPRVVVTARKPGLLAELNARLVQKIDNWLLRELASKREFKRLIADNFFSGIGTGFFGYDSEFGFSERLATPDGGFSLSQFDTSGNRIEFNSTVNPGMPWFLRARPEDTVFPWGATDRESLHWVTHRVFRTVRDVKKDKKYNNTSNLQGQHVPLRTHPEGTVANQQENTLDAARDLQWVELWQIHDGRTGKIRVLSMDHDKWLRNEADEEQVEGLPVETITFNPDTDFIYGIPDARIIEPQLLELIDIRTQAMKHRRVDILKGLLRKDAFPEGELNKLLSEDVKAFAEVETDVDDIRKAVALLNPGVSGILQDLIAQGEVARGDVRETVGFSRVAQGDFQGKTHITKEETQQVFRALNIRLDERRDEMADLIGRVVRKWNQVIFTRWTAERVAQIVGPDGAKLWLKYTGPQLRDEYDLNVVAEEGPPLDSRTKLDMGLKAAEVWAKLNAGAIKQGAPVPFEIQRLIFSQFESSGLDIDRLLAQTQALAGTGQTPPGVPQGAGVPGGSPQSAVSPRLLAQILSQGGQGQ